MQTAGSQSSAPHRAKICSHHQMVFVVNDVETIKSNVESMLLERRSTTLIEQR